jgi:hypothetical protein
MRGTACALLPCGPLPSLPLRNLGCVADDSSLRQAKIDELKGKQARQDCNPSLTWRQVMCLLLKTTVERTKPLCLYSRQEKRCLAGE